MGRSLTCSLGSGLESASLFVNNGGEVVGFSTFDTTTDTSLFKGATDKCLRGANWHIHQSRESSGTHI